MSDDSLPLENAHDHKNVFPFAMAEIASRRAVAGLAGRRASAAWLTGHGRVQNVKVREPGVELITEEVLTKVCDEMLSEPCPPTSFVGYVFMHFMRSPDYIVTGMHHAILSVHHQCKMSTAIRVNISIGISISQC